MTIENLLTELIGQLKKNNELLSESNETRIELLKKSTGTSEKTKKAESTEKEKPAAEKSKKASPDKADKKKSSVTVESTLEAFGEYLDTDDEEERAARKLNVKAILNELGLKKMSEIEDKADMANALKWLELFKKGKKVNFNEDPETGDSDDDDDEEDLV